MSLAPIPAQPADVTSGCLSAVLSRAGEPVIVHDVRVEPVGTGQTGATYRITATNRGHHPDLLDAFIVKLPSQDQEVLSLTRTKFAH